MLTLLVCASLLLHVLTFIAIRALQSNVQQLENRHQKDKQEYEAMLSSILNELKEENDRLLHAEPQPAKAYSPKNVEERNSQSSPASEDDAHSVSDYTPPQPVEEEDQVSMSNLSRVLQLHDQGLASVEIAKQLGMGKTEVELILLMKKNGENNRKS
ncbi:DUF6115 domain-containing protein [Terribacillus saccharophilus]|uniref:Coupling factor for flagellin transcription and translation n=1 Tax=Terribacillus saccharophilus TaxID=361277 RepID=A0A268AAG6_9BACI|nr:hypothetical protein [Terribacillus saccharophilus]PAD21125.1 hypothetical protein CHH64_11290 [Terribacillus saccharophilus]